MDKGHPHFFLFFFDNLLARQWIVGISNEIKGQTMTLLDANEGQIVFYVKAKFTSIHFWRGWVGFGVDKASRVGVIKKARYPIKVNP